MKLIDAHIHLDKYESILQADVLAQLGNEVASVIAVSMNESSCRANLELAEQYPGMVHPAFGYHPELLLPQTGEIDSLIAWITRHQDKAIAIGEVGLPYYARQEAEAAGHVFDQAPYIALLDQFVRLAVQLDKPIVLHAVYEDAATTCDLLELHGCTRAHFHWFKGDPATVERMAASGYYISITPDVVYEEDIRELVRRYPIDLIMAETDGPWPFEGPHAGQPTMPAMVRSVMEEIASIRGLSVSMTEDFLFRNTKRFYRIG
jgi:TatD DNase family protein